MGQKQWSNSNKSELEVVAVMISWALYGAAMHWIRNHTTPPEQYVKQLLPFINNAMNMDKENYHLI